MAVCLKYGCWMRTLQVKLSPLYYVISNTSNLTELAVTSTEIYRSLKYGLFSFLP
jgi:hypothetical protein